LAACVSENISVKMKISMDHCSKDTGSRKPQHLQKTVPLPSCPYGLPFLQTE